MIAQNEKINEKIAEMACLNPDFFLMISCIDERFKIVDYLLKNRSGEYCIGTQKDIAQSTNISLPRVRAFLKILEDNNLLEKYSQGVYKLTIPIGKEQDKGE